METDNVMIHVRFAPNGEVVEIGERPADATPREWFNCLSDKAGTHYRTFAGGRGVFSLTRQEIDMLKGDFAA